MVEVITKITCDIDGCCAEIIKEDKQELQVIFHSGAAKYLVTHSLDICEHCMRKVLNGNYVHYNGRDHYFDLDE